MRTEPLILMGAGGHARVVIDALGSLGDADRLVLCSDDPAQVGQSVLGCEVVLFRPQFALGALFHICVGNVATRQSQHERLAAAGAIPLTIVHPASICSGSARLEPGTFLAAGAIVAAEAHIGLSSIINHAAIVDHQAIVGDFCHIAPGVTLAGNVKVGRASLIGAGANVLPGLEVGLNCVLGAGAVLTRNMPDREVFAGIPARRMT